VLSVDPSSFQRSAGLTGGGTVSWQCAPATFAGVPHSAEADASLIAAARTLAAAAQGPRITEDSRAMPLRSHGCAAAMIMADGSTTADTSLREPLGRHPLVRTMLAEARTELARAGRAAGRGECVEVSLVSSRMYDLDRKWAAAGRPGDLRAFALDGFRGATVAVRQIGDVNGRRHGERRGSCRACSPLLAALGIEVAGPALDSRFSTAEPAQPVPPDIPQPGAMASRSTARREWLLGTPFRFAGRGAAGLAAVARGLVAAGPGATALILATWSAADDGHYAWTAANRDGVVWWLDAPSSETSRGEPLYASIVDGVWAIVLAPDGRPAGAGPPVPLPMPAAGPFDPARPTGFDAARLAEVRALATEYAAEYAGANAAGRVAIRVEISTLVDELGVRPGTAESTARWAALPSDIAAHLLTLTTPAPSAKAVATVLAADPNRLNAAQRAWRADFEEHLAGAFLGGNPSSADAVAADIAGRMHRLAVAGEHAPASVPRIPAYAGQVIGLPPDRLAVLREADPALAERAGATGVYIDLRGRPDLAPYAAAGPTPIALEEPPDDHDLSTDEGRADLCAEDRARARAAFRAAHGADPGALTLLSSHEFHYVGAGESRSMALVPDLLAAAVRAIVPVRPPPGPRRPNLRKRRRRSPAPGAEPTARAAEPAAPAPTVRATASVPVTRPAPPDDTPSVDVAYYALADSSHHPTGLLVVAMLPTGPQTVRLEAPGARTAGSPTPVSRQRAEEISREALGFELPAEPRLPELRGG
jgi:hypothetical protein